MYKMGPCEIICSYILEHERPLILSESHAGVRGGHYPGKSIVHKILQEGLWWPTMHVDVEDHCRNYDVYQSTRKLSWCEEMTLVPQITLQGFEKWVVDLVGPISPTWKHTGACYIITATDYLTRWVEAASVKDYTVENFLFKNVMTWFGCPNILISDKGAHFVN